MRVSTLCFWSRFQKTNKNAVDNERLFQWPQEIGDGLLIVIVRHAHSHKDDETASMVQNSVVCKTVWHDLHNTNKTAQHHHVLGAHTIK